MRPHVVHIDPGRNYAGETYIWCECVLPGGFLPVMKGALKSEYSDSLFYGTTREELTAWLDRHPQEAEALPKPRRKKGNMSLPDWIAPYEDPMTPMERWMSRLPNTEMEEHCHCGSGKPVIYWSPDDGTCCEACRFSFAVYIPHAVMYNIMSKFGIPEELQEEIYRQVNEEEK